MAVSREVAYYVETFPGSVSGGAPLTVSVTPSFPHSADRFYLIVVAALDTLGFDSSITGVTVGGVAATLLHTLNDSAGNTLGIYKFVGPPKATHNVVASFVSSTVNAYMTVNCFEEIDPIDGIGATDTATGTTGASDSRTLTSADLATSLCLQAASLFGGTTNVTVTPVSPFSNTGTAQVGASPVRFRSGASVADKPGGASVTARYNFSTNPKPWMHAAYEVKAARILPQACLMGCGF